MPTKGKRAAVVYFVLGLVVGSLAGLIAGVLLFENRPSLVTSTAAAFTWRRQFASRQPRPRARSGGFGLCFQWPAA